MHGCHPNGCGRIHRSLFISTEPHWIVTGVFIGWIGVFGSIQPISGKNRSTPAGARAFFAAESHGLHPIP